jgi:hypothetical protein
MNSILYGNLRLEVAGRAGSRVDRLARRPPWAFCHGCGKRRGASLPARRDGTSNWT